MKEEKRVFEVFKSITREITESKSERFILQLNDDGQWVYHAPTAQDHTVEQLEDILNKLKELNVEAQK